MFINKRKYNPVYNMSILFQCIIMEPSKHGIQFVIGLSCLMHNNRTIKIWNPVCNRFVFFQYTKISEVSHAVTLLRTRPVLSDNIAGICVFIFNKIWNEIFGQKLKLLIISTFSFCHNLITNVVCVIICLHKGWKNVSLFIETLKTFFV